ncbi:sulfite exporter TauE/SafE family protein [Pontibacter rugosus]|uniref:Probable membrane transporter protein n=1 Tax=Pontibacter rugosus TaxID=1745966 RepID=A0ABW3SM18_9BACT
MDPTTLALLLIVLFFFIALLYSSIGFGGGSSYLALLSIFYTNFEFIRTTALVCNIAVVLGSVLLYYKNGLIDWKRFLPFIAISIPAAFIGAQFQLSQQVFFILLGLSLVASAILLLIKTLRSPGAKKKNYPAGSTVALGGGVGLLSGVVGIGGGIFLSPVLNLMRWDEPRKIAALASFFILANSVSGIGGLVASGSLATDLPLQLLLLLAVFAGGQLGIRLSLGIIKPDVIKSLTAVLVLYVGVRLVLLYSLGIKI